MAYTGSGSKNVSSSYLFITLQSFYTKIKGLLAGKSDTTHTHNYAGSSSSGGAATTALACTGNSATATKATQDSAGQQINKTYIKDLSVSGTKITFTKGDGTTNTITTQDTNTTYTAGTGITLAGLAFHNAGVRSIGTGSTNGTIRVNTGGLSDEVAVKGLGSAAYTASTAYAPTSHTHNYAGSSTAGGVATSALTADTATFATKSNGIEPTGFGYSNFTFHQVDTVDGVFNGYTGRAHYLISNLKNGQGYYNYVIGLPFWGVPMYRRQTGNSTSISDWHNFYTTENITYGTRSMTAGTSLLDTGHIYLQYEE